MHTQSDQQQRPKKVIPASKAILISISGIFILALFYAGVLIPGKNPKVKNQAALKKNNRQVKLQKPPGQMPIKIEDHIKKGDTIISILINHGIEQTIAHQFFTEIKPVYDLRKIGAGNKYTLFIDKETKEIKHFKYIIDTDHYLEAWKDQKDNCYRAELFEIPYEMKREFVTGEIRDSLFQAILDAGEKPELADLMASLFEYDIDFNRDLRVKDSFMLLVEKMYLQGQFVRYGSVLTAQFINDGNTIWVIRYTDPEGKTAYYHPDGRSVKKMFLRCPLPFMRVSSSYGNRRHPLWGFSARHNGVDLSAPIGTKIRATAAGSVLKKSIDNSRGRYICIRHKNNYVSHYYHLSSFAKEVKPGAAVEQGQVIGYVGNSGWSTGPHLHYGMQKSGRFFNPLTLNSPAKEPVKEIFMEDFKEYSFRVSLLLTGSQLVKIPDAIMVKLLERPPFPLPKPVLTSI